MEILNLNLNKITNKYDIKIIQVPLESWGHELSNDV